MKIITLALVSVFMLSGCKGSKKGNARANNTRQKAQQQVASPTVDTGSKAEANVNTNSIAAPQALPSVATTPAVTPTVPAATVPLADPAQVVDDFKSTRDDRDKEKERKATVPAATPPPAVPKVTEKSETKVSAAKPEVKEDKKPEYEKIKEMTFEETFDLGGVLSYYFGSERAAKAATAKIPDSIKKEDITSQVDGTHEKFSITLKNKEAVLAEFKDVAIALNRPVKKQSGDYSIVGVCIRSKCEILFAVIIKEGKDADKTPVEKYPYMFKLTDGQYVRVRGLNDADFKTQLEKMPKPVDPNKVAIQMRPKLKYNENYKKSEEKILESIRSQMKKFNMGYSDRIVKNAKPGTCSPDISAKNEDGFSYSLKCEFTDSKKPIEFAGSLKNSMTKMTEKAGGLILTGQAIIPNEFFMTAIESNLHVSPLKNVSTAMTAQICEVLTEEKTAYAYCANVPAALVLNTKAIEGKMEGPVYVEDEILEDKDGKQTTQPQISETREVLKKAP